MLLTWLRLALAFADRAKLLRAERSRDPRPRATDAGQGPLLEALTAAFRRGARLPGRRPPRVEGVTVAEVARLGLLRALRRVAAERDGLGVDPLVRVDPVTGDATELDAVAARVRAVRPVVRLPRVRARGLVASASRLGLQRRRAQLFTHSAPAFHLVAVHFSELFPFSARL